jgi:hypothetical protein
VGLIAQFSYLQVLDLLTTMIFLSAGLQEGNPLVKIALQSAGHPLQALLFVKVLACGIAFYCWRSGRHTVLARANWFFAGIVAWNVVALLLSVNQFS